MEQEKNEMPRNETIYSESTGIPKEKLEDGLGRHKELLNSLFEKIKDGDIKEIFDAGSGGSSMAILLDYFKNAHIDAVVFPGDQRKIKSVNDRIKSDRYTLNEIDIVKTDVAKKYDLVLAHLLLGEAVTWGNTVEGLLEKLLKIDTRYLVLFDMKEDPSIDFQYLANRLNSNGLEIIAQGEIEKKDPQEYKGSERKAPFIARNYVAYLVHHVK